MGDMCQLRMCFVISFVGQGSMPELPKKKDTDGPLALVLALSGL